EFSLLVSRSPKRPPRRTGTSAGAARKKAGIGASHRRRGISPLPFNARARAGRRSPATSAARHTVGLGVHIRAGGGRPRRRPASSGQVQVNVGGGVDVDRQLRFGYVGVLGGDKFLGRDEGVELGLGELFPLGHNDLVRPVG